MADLFTESSADISACGQYRYTLTRKWGPGPLVCFLMLNPSTADATEDDATIRRCIGFARAGKHGGIVVANLFALRSTDPLCLLETPDPIGPGNDGSIAAAVELAWGNVICAWGSPSSAALRKLMAPRIEAVIGGPLKGRRLLCLGTAKDGNPRHPLYLSAEEKPRIWDRGRIAKAVAHG